MEEQRIAAGMKVRLDSGLRAEGTVETVSVDGFFCLVDFGGNKIGVEASKLIALPEVK